jgi:hypothetical protein
MTVEPQARVRCRQITEDDLEGLADLLARGFPRTHREYWCRGFAHWKQMPAIEGVPRFGYVLDAGLGPPTCRAGMSSLPGARIRLCWSQWRPSSSMSPT